MQSIYIGTSATNEELFRMNGTLPAERIEELLDSAAALDSVTERAGHIDEAKAQYPDEDFLTDVIHDLEEIVASMRGERKAALQTAIDALQQIEIDTRNSSEYGIEELSKLEAVLP